MIPGGILPILDVGPRLPWSAAQRVAAAWLEGGAQALQLRAKEASGADLLRWAQQLATWTAAAGAALYVNDRPDVALLAGAAGVHLGQEDLPAARVRPWLPPGMRLGVSCHNPHQLERVLEEGVADYAGFGPVFPTGSKARPDPVVGLAGLAAARARAPGLCLVAIGGITLERLPAVRAAGASAAAMIAALTAAPDPRRALEDARAAWRS